MPKPVSSIWFIWPVLATTLFLGGPFLAHFHVIAPFRGFLTFAASVLPALISLLFGAYLVLTGNSGKGLVCLIVGAVPLATVAVGFANGRKFPRINDISTNLDNPPRLIAATAAPENVDKDLSYPEDFKRIVREAYPDLIALQIDQPADQVLAHVKQTLEAHPEWQIVRIDDAAMTIELTETDGLFQFTDDAVIRVMAMDQDSQVDVRSRSRVGQGDFGANAARIRRILAAIQQP